MPRGGSKPGERRGGRKPGTPNKRSIPAIKAEIVRAGGPKLDSLALGRLAATGILEEINKLRYKPKYDPAQLIDWYVKLARVAEGYISYEHPRVSPVEREDRNDYNVQVHADLSRLNTEQLIALKQLALIASAGSIERYLQTPITLLDQLIKEKQAEETRTRVERDFGKLRRQQTGRDGLLNFVRYFWHTLEPKSRKMVEGGPWRRSVFTWRR
jgi:hypothetical protein